MITATQLPVYPNNPRYQYTIQLGNRVFVLKFRWLPLLERWVCDVHAVDGTALGTGRIVECGANLLRWVFPAVDGVLTAARLTNPQHAPGLDWNGVALSFIVDDET